MMQNTIYKNKLGVLVIAPLLLLSQALAAEGDLPGRHYDNQGGCPGERDTKTEEVTFLGVYATKVDHTLTRQLGFPRGFYLTVQHVEPGSPAEEAGLEMHDVLQKVDDQILINPDQLRELVRSKEAGSNIGLTYFRGGKENTTSAKLTSREAPENQGFPREGFQDFGFPRQFRDFEELKRRMPREYLPENFRNHSRSFNFDTKPENGGNHIQSSTQSQVSSGSQSTIQVNNQDGSLYLEMDNGKGHLTIRDKSGQNLYDGDYKPGQKVKGLPKQWQEQLQEIDVQLQNGKETGKKKEKKSDKEPKKE